MTATGAARERSSVVEPLVLCALLAVLALVGGPPILPIVERAAATEAAVRTAGAVSEARAWAIASGRCVELVVERASPTALALRVGGGARCTDAPPPSSSTRLTALGRGVVIEDGARVRLRSDGRLDGAAPLALTVRKGSAARVVTIDVDGRACVLDGPPGVRCGWTP